jgi:hypothetical protein
MACGDGDTSHRHRTDDGCADRRPTCAVTGRAQVIRVDEWSRLVFAFKWPSISYALDILAWDVFFPIAAFFAAAAAQGHGLARLVRVLLFTSAALSAIGFFCVVLANMQVRNIGIIGYAVLFPVAAGVLAKLMAADEPTGLRKS